MTVPPGVGKARLAVGLRLKAIERGYRVLFTTAAALITSLTLAMAEGRLEDRLKVYTVPRRLIIGGDRLPADRPHRRQPLRPAHQPPLRAGPDDTHEQPELWQLGRGLR